MYVDDQYGLIRFDLIKIATQETKHIQDNILTYCY